MNRLPKKKKSALPKPTCGCVYPGCICAHDASGCQTCDHDEAEGLLIACCICVARGHHKLPAGLVPPPVPPAAPEPDPDDESMGDRAMLMRDCLDRAVNQLGDTCVLNGEEIKITSEAVAIVGVELFRSAAMDRCCTCGGDTFRPGHRCPRTTKKNGEA